MFSLGLAQAGVMELASLTSRTGVGVAEAAARFAVRSEGVEQLTAEERNALQEVELLLPDANGLK